MAEQVQGIVLLRSTCQCVVPEGQVPPEWWVDCHRMFALSVDLTQLLTLLILPDKDCKSDQDCNSDNCKRACNTTACVSAQWAYTLDTSCSIDVNIMCPRRWVEASLLALEQQPADARRADEADHPVNIAGAVQKAGEDGQDVADYRSAVLPAWMIA